jgi:flagellar motility protein MotE (MotC chaperone)
MRIMSKKQMLILIVVFVVGWVVSLTGSFFLLKPEKDESLADSLAMVDSLEQADRERGLNLTIDLSKAVQVRQGGPFMMPELAESPDSTLAIIEDDSLELAEMDTSLDSSTTITPEQLQAEVDQAVELAEEAEVKIEELEGLLALLSTEADSVDQANAKRLAKIIESMRPDDAAAVIIGLGSQTTARLLISMRQRSAAKILSSMPRDRAAEVAKYLSQAYEKSAI